MTNEEFVDLQKQGVLISNSVSAEKLSQLAHNFSPKKTEHDLVRLGPRFDGGYLVPMTCKISPPAFLRASRITPFLSRISCQNMASIRIKRIFP